MRRLKVTGIKLKMYVYPLYLYDMRGEEEKIDQPILNINGVWS